jgi:hypothetical protein
MLSTRTLREAYQRLNRTVSPAMARGYAARNVVTLCEIPRGRSYSTAVVTDRIFPEG